MHLRFLLAYLLLWTLVVQSQLKRHLSWFAALLALVQHAGHPCIHHPDWEPDSHRSLTRAPQLSCDPTLDAVFLIPAFPQHLVTGVCAPDVPSSSGFPTLGKNKCPSSHMQPWDLGCLLYFMVPRLAQRSIAVVFVPSPRLRPAHLHPLSWSPSLLQWWAGMWLLSAYAVEAGLTASGWDVKIPPLSGGLPRWGGPVRP